MKSSVILLSGGLDSAVNLALSMDKDTVKMALTFDYGQKSAQREVTSAHRLSMHYGVPHTTIDLNWLSLCQSAIVNKDISIPKVDINYLDDAQTVMSYANAVWVPNRNGVFINIAASFAEMYEADIVVAGFNAEEATAFPDNSASFVQASNDCLSFSTISGVKVHAYTLDMRKYEIARLAIKLKVPLHDIWSCYSNGDVMCGTCDPCQRIKRAFNLAGISDLQSIGVAI